MSIIETVLYIRAILINVYKRFEGVFRLIFKFIIGLWLFGIINDINMPGEAFAKIDSYFAGGMSLMLIAFIFALLPASAAFCLLAFDIALNISSHLELSVMGLLLMLCLILFYVRMAPRESWLIIFTLLGFYCKIPYIAPLFAGLYFPLTSTIPIILGIYIYGFAPRFLSLFETVETAGFEFLKLTETAGPSAQGLIDAATSDFSWVFISFVFAMTVLIVYVISHLTMDYAKELSVLFGGVLCMVGLLLVSFITDVDMGGASVFLYSIFAVLLTLIIHFFDLALDYGKAERVEFSDEDNYYYVRVIPKLIVTEKTATGGRKPKKKGPAAAHTRRRDRGDPSAYDKYDYDYEGDDS